MSTANLLETTNTIVCLQENLKQCIICLHPVLFNHQPSCKNMALKKYNGNGIFL